MIFRIFYLDNDFILEENRVNVLEFHDKSFASKVIKKLISEEEIYDDEFLILLDENGKEINIPKNSIIITDLFNINFNDKKILNKLYDLLEEEIKTDESFYLELNEINQLLSNLVKDKLNQSNIDLELNQELKIKELLKFYNVQVLRNKEDDIITDLFNYLDLIVELNLCKIVFIVNLKSYLDEEQIEQAYKFFLYNRNIKIILIETNKYKKIENEKKLIIDKSFDDYYI